MAVFPGPDRGTAVFPSADRGTAVFPGADRGAAAFPPYPKARAAAAVTLVDIISTVAAAAVLAEAHAETTVDVESTIAVLGAAHTVTVVDVESSITARTVVAVATATVLDLDSTTTLTAAAVAELVSTIEVNSTPMVTGVAARAVLESIVDVTSTGRLAGGVTEAETVVDVTSSIEAVAVTAVAAATAVDVASNIILAAPSVDAAPETIVDIGSTTTVTGVAASAAAVSTVDVESTGTVEQVVPPFPPSGMNKSGNYTLPSTNTWHTMPTWAIRSGYPDTVIVTNGIEVPAGVEVMVAGQLTFGYTDSFSGNGMRMRVMAGATQIGAVAGTPGNGSVAALTQFTWKNETGATQLLTVQGYSTSSSFGRNIVQGGVNSYLTLVAVVPLVERAADSFDDGPGGLTGPLSEEWVTTGGGTLGRVNGRLNGVGTPSVPLSYAWWHEPMPSDTQVVRAVMRWDGYDPEHSACGLVVRANPYQDPVTNPGAQFGVQFSWTRSIMALYYEDYDATNGFVPVTGVAQYVSTSKFPEGALVELRAEGNLYTARVNGTIMLQGTVENSVIPFSNRYVGLTIQDDSAVQNGGGPPGRLDDFQALTP
ncbi:MULTISPECIES: hypothetical protein [Rhodococcus]|uniref:hypothetical protein n=1 Tax=Rhodococcus TaxID=1827 RepID=UPI00143E1282|nr:MULTISPECIES: hypothetical protein [Rhodococcus]QIX48955.1 hypothetical protein HFP48_04875 [Rhodococcus sp. DMU1]QRI75994.1 hypothetical protein JQ505_26555 [Rhodococcus aetherivorans]QSE59405.1 hypothetical protein JYA75_27655 [Rhodococcus sp. PSBB066]QSE69270.1 hypothetical protein JYA91_27800 [Rhodococcus sp. PSBB049]